MISSLAKHAFRTQDIEMQQIKVPCFAHTTVSLEILGRWQPACSADENVEDTPQRLA
jgi:hypothetical protein